MRKLRKHVITRTRLPRLRSLVSKIAVGTTAALLVAGIATGCGESPGWNLSKEKKAQICPVDSKKTVMKSSGTKIGNTEIRIDGIEARAKPVIIIFRINGKRNEVRFGDSFELTINGEPKTAVFTAIGLGNFTERDFTLCVY